MFFTTSMMIANINHIRKINGLPEYSGNHTYSYKEIAEIADNTAIFVTSIQNIECKNIARYARASYKKYLRHRY